MWFGQAVVLQTDPIILDQPVGSLPIVDDARWSAALTSHSWGALIVWLVLMIVLQAVTWPLVRRLFPRFPDQGWGFARLVSLLLAGGLVWYGASLKVIEFRAIWAGLALLVLAIAAFGLDRWLLRGERQVREPWYRQHYIVAVEGVFWAAFGLFLLFRLLNPDAYHPAWGGEKPMEFAHINAILRGAHFPPYDPWYAGGLLNYYYYGMYLVAFMMKVTGIPSEIAFNLAQPTIIALLAAGAFSVAMALGRSLTRRTSIVLGAGIVGVLLVNVAGNLVVAARAFTALSAASPPLSDFGYWFWTPTRIVSYTINEFPWFTATYADLHAHVVALPITVLLIGLAYSMMQSPRDVILAVARPRQNRDSVVLLVGCLVLSGLSLGSLYMTNAWDAPTYAVLTAVAVLVSTRAIRGIPLRLAVSIGLTAGVAVLAVLMALPFVQHYVALYGDLASTTSESVPIEVMSHFGVFFLIIAFGLSLIYLRAWTEPASAWLGPVAALGLLSLLIVRWYGVELTAEWVAFMDKAIVAALALWFAYAMVRPQRRQFDFRLPDQVGTGFVLAYGALMFWLLATDRVAAGMFVALGVPAIPILFSRVNVAERFAALLVTGAMLIGAAMELVFLVDGLSGGPWYRMNTVFKFYNQVWIMGALGGAGLVALMAREVLESRRAPLVDASQSPGEMGLLGHTPEPETNLGGAGWAPADEPTEADTPVGPANHHTTVSLRAPAGQPLGAGALSWAQVGLAVTAIVMVASLAYPLLATSSRLQQRYPQDGASLTLNALDWMNYGEQQSDGSPPIVFSYDEDRDVIDWFNAEVPGSPVIVEASLSQYLCGTARIGNYTGLPDVIGWPWHEVQQRDWIDIGERQDQVRLLYSSTDPAVKQEILTRYDVEYIVVGDLERFYPAADCTATDNAAGIAAFDQMMTAGILEVAFQSGDTIVYRVVQAN